jgi:hypothetical protein
MKAFSFTAILLAASLISLSGCSAPLNVEGKTFSAEKSRYVFGEGTAELQVKQDKYLLSVHNTPFGDYLFEPTSYDANKESLLGVMNRDGVRFFLVPSTGCSFGADGYAQEKDTDKKFAELFSADSSASFDEEKVRKLAENAAETISNTAFNGFSGFFIDSDGRRSEDLAAYKNVMDSVARKGTETYAICFWVNKDVVAQPGNWQTVATVPYEVLNTTVRIDLSAADFSAKIDQAPLLQKKYQYIRDAGKVVFRVEDDENFLYNPVTGNRYTRQ